MNPVGYMKTKRDLPMLKQAQLRRLLSNFDRIDLERTDQNLLRIQLRQVLKYFDVPYSVWNAGCFLYRGNCFAALESKPQYVARISFPPADFCTLGRANQGKQPKFYCSSHPDPLPFELGLREGDYMTLATWRVRSRFAAASVGFTPSSFEALNSLRSHETMARYTALDKGQRRITDFLANWFLKKDAKDQRSLYKLSAAMAEELLARPHGIQSDAVELAGLHYPSVAMFANQDNFALFPEFVSRNMEIMHVEFIKILESRSDRLFGMEPIDHAKTFGPDGEIEWEGKADWSHYGDQVRATKFLATAGGFLWDPSSRMAYKEENGTRIPVGFQFRDRTVL